MNGWAKQIVALQRLQRVGERTGIHHQRLRERADRDRFRPPGSRAASSRRWARAPCRRAARCGARPCAQGTFVKPKGSLWAALSGSQKKRNRRNSAIRARVEHLFRIVKRQFGYTKVRYRGLAKNTAQVMVLIGLANLYALRRRLAA
jgi:Transposase DDE domain